MLLLAVSGGIDSMYMVSKAFSDGEALFAVAHCNFCLRASESDGDELFVRNWCGERGITCHVRKFDTITFAKRMGISIEMAARDLRYAWFAELCHKHGYEAVAVAHNANDNAETLLLNMLRGTGSKGLRGMDEESVLSCDKSVRLFRPLLHTTRAAIESWMKENGCTWREDSTNTENEARRNIIRNEVFPHFAQINPSFIRTLERDMKHFRQTYGIAEDYFKESAEKVLMEDGRIDLRSLLQLRHWEYILFRLTERSNLSEETFDKLVELLHSGRTISGKVFQSPSHTVAIRKKTLEILPR